MKITTSHSNTKFYRDNLHCLHRIEALIVANYLMEAALLLGTWDARSTKLKVGHHEMEAKIEDESQNFKFRMGFGIGVCGSFSARIRSFRGSLVFILFIEEWWKLWILFELCYIYSTSHNTEPSCDRAASIITSWKLSSSFFSPKSIDDCRSRGNMVCIEVWYVLKEYCATRTLLIRNYSLNAFRPFYIINQALSSRVL